MASPGAGARPPTRRGIKSAPPGWVSGGVSAGDRPGSGFNLAGASPLRAVHQVLAQRSQMIKKTMGQDHRRIGAKAFVAVMWRQPR